jgi:hypothetical protein
MSKQLDTKVFLTSQQYELAKTLYMQWLCDASNLVKFAHTRESWPQPRYNQEGEIGTGESGPGQISLPRCDNPGSRGSTASGGQLRCRARRDVRTLGRWEQLAADEIDNYQAANKMLKYEFNMAWDLHHHFPLHFMVLKQTAVHLPHEANVEQIFSRAGLLTDPNIDQDYSLPPPLRKRHIKKLRQAKVPWGSKKPAHG